MVLQVVQKLLQATPNIELDLSKSKFVLRRTRSSCRLGMPLGSSVGKIWVVASVELGIQARPGALPMKKEEHEVSRQPSRPHMPYEVGHVLVVMVYPLSKKRQR